MMKTWIVTGIIAISCIVAQAHNAPSGWMYPQECCNETDCHPVSCDALHEVDGGIAFLDFKFTKEMIRNSQDGYCHVCIGHYGPSPAQARPHCLFMTPRT